MRHAPILALASILTVGLVLGCKSDEPQRQAPAAEDPEPDPEPVAPPPAKIDAPPPAPEPTTPAEIDTARKNAMIAGNDKDVIKYCELAQVDPKKTDPQILLGCALASCRIGDVDKAKVWAKNLPKPLKDQAIKVCSANAAPL